MMSMIVVLISMYVVSAFFSTSETSFTCLSVLDLVSLKRTHPFLGKILNFLKQNPRFTLTTIVIGNNIANILASTLTSIITIHYFGIGALTISTMILTFTMLFFGEITPKNLSLYYYKTLICWFAPILFVFYFLFYPFTLLFFYVSVLLDKMLKLPKNTKKISLENFQDTIQLAHSEGLFQQYENELISNILRIKIQSTVIQDIMTHRKFIFSLNQNTTLIQAHNQILEHNFSRIPIYHNSPENIIGLIYTKEILLAYENPLNHEKNISDWIKPTLTIPSVKKIYETLYLMHKEHKNLAIVIDEYGGLSGLVTQEDIIEEITGDLYDEDDAPILFITQSKDNQYLIRGETPIHLFQQYWPLQLFQTTHKSNTIGGALLEYLDRFPLAKEKITFPEGSFQVQLLQNNQIKTLLWESFQKPLLSPHIAPKSKL